METGAMKNKKKTTEDVNIDFNKAIGKSESNCLHCMRYGGYLLFSTIRDFFLGEKPTKKMTTSLPTLQKRSFLQSPTIKIQSCCHQARNY